jgi:lysophospholipase L1-like esterase
VSWNQKKYVPSNTTTLDKLTDNGTTLLFNGNPISGGSTTVSSKWSGKVWNVIGDSITEHNFRTTKNYHDYIKDKISCTINNYGISGTGYFTPSGSGGTNAIYQRIGSLNASADLITVFAGTNDWGQVGKTLVLGSFGDIDGSTSFYGAVDSTISQLITKYPTKTLAVFTPLPRSNAFNSVANSAGITLTQVADAIIAVCNKYGVPVLDLYRKSGLFPWNTTANNTYFNYQYPSGTGDGLHPNDAGHQILADKILSFLNTL